MQGLLVQLLTLIVFEAVALVTPTSAFSSRCGALETANVTLSAVKVPGPDFDVVYRRISATREHFEFVVNATVSLPGANFAACAKAAGRKDLPGFSFDGVCTGFYINKQFVNCQTGGWIIYLRYDACRCVAEVDFPVVTTYEEAPYEIIDNGNGDSNRRYMLSAFVEVDEDHPRFRTVNKFTAGHAETNTMFTFNQTIIEAYVLMLDVNVCLTDGTYGLPVVTGEDMNDFKWPIMYFFHECGNTVEVSIQGFYTELLVFSHPGFSCKYYPTWLPNECTVKFETQNYGGMKTFFGFFFSETDSDGAGLNMTITGGTKTMDVYQSNERSGMGSYASYTVTLSRQPSKRAIGFFVEFY